MLDSLLARAGTDRRLRPVRRGSAFMQPWRRVVRGRGGQMGFMAKRLLIDAVHPEEIRVAALDGERLVTVDVDTREGSQLAGNLYVASVARVEASLQAAFVDFGGERHGFLPYSEIHPDYFQLPEGMEPQSGAADGQDGEEDGRQAEDGAANNGDSGNGDADNEASRAAPARRGRRRGSYAIQEVIRNRQVMLVQVHKEPRGDKGAVLTTYVSLAGRYCVLMPNAGRGGGVSRKISAEDRKRLREIAGELDVAPGHGVIIRTAGCARTRPEIKRDYAALLKQWDEIRERALVAVAPKLIHQESNLMRRAVRDFYDRETTEILIEGDEAYQEARRQMRMLTPSHVKNVKQFNKQPRGGTLPQDSPPIFDRFGIERQLGELFSPRVSLPSGGSIVISPSEALTAIDVNSGRATGERNIEETAYRTNLEAADAVARQLRLRDISGLVVIDFIDMVEERNRHAVERRLRDRLRADYSRTQIGRISSFGLLEMSRQRLARSLVEMSTQPCRSCEGAGRARSPVSLGLALLRRVEAESGDNVGRTALVRTSPQVAEFLANRKREDLGRIEARRGIRIHLRAATDVTGADGGIAWHAASWDPIAEALQGVSERAGEGLRERRRRRSRGQDGQRARGGDSERDGDRRGRRGRRSRSRGGGEAEAAVPAEDGMGDVTETPSRGRRRRHAQEEAADAEPAIQADAPEPAAEEDPGRRRKRGRRGGRRRSEEEAAPDEVALAGAEREQDSEAEGRGDVKEAPSRGRRRRHAQEEAEAEPAIQADAPEPAAEEDPGRRPKRGRRGGRRRSEEEAAPEEAALAGAGRDEDSEAEGRGDVKEAPSRGRRRRHAQEEAEAEPAIQADAPEPAAEEDPGRRPKRTRRGGRRRSEEEVAPEEAALAGAGRDEDSEAEGRGDVKEAPSRGRRRRHAQEEAAEAEPAVQADAPEPAAEEDPGRRPKRTRRGGRRRSEEEVAPEEAALAGAERDEDFEEEGRGDEDGSPSSGGDAARRRRRGRRGGRGRARRRPDAGEAPAEAGLERENVGNGGPPTDGTPIPGVSVPDDFGRSEVYDPIEGAT